MGTFGFGLMGHAAQHMCPVVGFLGYECPQQFDGGANSSSHHISKFQILSKTTMELGGYAWLLLGLAITVVAGFVLDFAAYYFSEYREVFRKREESVSMSRQQFFRWFALHTNRDSFA